MAHEGREQPRDESRRGGHPAGEVDRTEDRLHGVGEDGVLLPPAGRLLAPSEEKVVPEIDGARDACFAGLAGLGDLVATCSSPLSRNRTFGEKLGRGMTVEQVQETTRQTAEGVKSCRSVLDLARAHGVDVPITEAVVRVCHEGEAPSRMVKEIMSREAKPE